MVPWLVVVLSVYVRMSLRRLECRSARLFMLNGVSFIGFLIWGQVLSPPTTGGFASVNIMLGVLCPSTTFRAAMSASPFCVTHVCDFTLPMCVLYPMLSLVCMLLSTSCKRCL
jgi:hypothetical protein